MSRDTDTRSYLCRFLSGDWPTEDDMPDPACHHVSGMFWCTRRKPGHRKPHRYELQPITDDDLVKRIFEIWHLVHPNSRARMGWVIPAQVRERLLATVRRASDSAAGPVFVRPDAPTATAGHAARPAGALRRPHDPAGGGAVIKYTLFHLHRWSKWSEPQSEFADSLAAAAGRPFTAESMPGGWYQQRRCVRCNQIERRVL